MGLMARVFAIAMIFFVQPASAVEPNAPDALLSKDSAIAGQVRMLISDARWIRGKALRAGLIAFYEKRDFRPLWSGGDQRQAKAVIAEIEKADDYGLRASDYNLPDLSNAGSSAAFFDLAEVDVKLSVAAITYARDARGGRINPRSLSGYLDVQLDLPTPEVVLSALIKASQPDRYLRGLHPKHKEFEALRKKLLAIRGGGGKRQGPALPAGPTLKLGSKHDHVGLLRKRLKMADGSGNPKLFDEAVFDAVKAFQKTKGLSPDGVVGPGTRRLLNGQSRGGANLPASSSIWSAGGGIPMT